MAAESVKAANFFSPREGVTIRPPAGMGEGHWCGGHSVYCDRDTDRYVMYYRIRRPRRMPNDLRRGSELYVAESKDGVDFNTIWSANKRDFNARSVEKGTLAKTNGGLWRLYLSYQPNDSMRWQIDLLEAEDLSAFVPEKRRAILLPEDLGVPHVKDPVFVRVGGKDYLFANYTVTDVQESTLRAELNSAGEVENITRGILEPEPGKWDQYTCRLTSVLPGKEAIYFFYDGNDCFENLCEEKSGFAIAETIDQKPRKVTTDQPGWEGVRYVDAVRDLSRGVRFYYEYTRPDGSHELRGNYLDREV